jgi:ATP-dependent DNA helicase RecQ
MRYIVDILRGSNSEKIRESHKQLSVYGIGKDKPKEEWLHYVKELVQYGYLQPTDTEFPVLQLTAKSDGVLFKGEKVYLSAPVQVNIVKEPVIYQQHAYEKDLFENLKKLRNRIAHEENVPAYLIFSDSTLLDLATYLPLTADDLPKISGFGAFKIEKYGRPFLEIIQEFCMERGIGTRIEFKQTKKIVKRGPAPKERASDTKRLSYDLYREGKSMFDIATERQLSVNTIESHLSYYIGTGELDIDTMVSPEKQQLIKQAVERFGRLGLRNLKDNLPDNISYGDIKMAIAYFDKEGN